MRPFIQLFLFTNILFLSIESIGQIEELSIFAENENYKQSDLGSFNRNNIKKLISAKFKNFKSAIPFKSRLDSYEFKKIDFLSKGYQKKYKEQFEKQAPLLYSSINKGEYLVNLLTTEAPILKYHNLDGNFRISLNKSNSLQWIKEVEKSSIENFCSTYDTPIIQKTELITKNSNDIIPTVGIYIEVDHHTYLEFNGDLKAINDWVILLFAEVASVYAVDQIPIELMDVNIRSEEAIYDLDSGAVYVLQQFNDNVLIEGPHSDAHLLLSTRFLHGIANLQSLCGHVNSTAPIASAGLATGLTLNSSFNPTYNWSIYVIAHELGHILGSRHTHACVWIDGTQALDDCGQPEGSCIQGPRPPYLGGTIMSYCHYWSTTGINFSNGFGTEPSFLIKSHIINMSCSAVESSYNCSIGNPCDDNNSCTNNDKIIDENCACLGVLIDFNMNGICDSYDECPDEIEIDTINGSLEGYLAKQIVISTTEIKNGQTVYFSAGQEIILNQGFEVSAGAIFESQLYGCDSSN